MKPAYEIIEEYNYLSEEDKKEFKMLFDRVMALEEHDAKIKKQETYNKMRSLLKSDGTPYLHVEFLLKHILQLSDKEIKENKKFKK